MTCPICNRTLAPDEPVEDDGTCLACARALERDSKRTGIPATVIRYVMRHQPFRRADCAGLPKPCPLTGCRFHWQCIPSRAVGSVALRGEGDRGCSLDAMDAEPGRWTLDRIGIPMHLTRERVRQIEVAALRRVRRGCERAGISLLDFYSATGWIGNGLGARDRLREQKRAWRMRKKARKMRGAR